MIISHRHLTEGTRASEAGLILQWSIVVIFLCLFNKEVLSMTGWFSQEGLGETEMSVILSIMIKMIIIKSLTPSSPAKQIVGWEVWLCKRERERELELERDRVS